MHGTPRDWAMLLALVAMWGSSFMFNKLALASVPALTIVAFRLVLGALTLLAVVYARGMRLPPLGRIWIAYTVLAAVGNAVPFYLITSGQRLIDSAVAGILISVMPLGTLVLAHFFVAGEHITRSRVIGFALGFCGIVLLMGPAALSGFGGSLVQVLAQVAVLAGALCYSTNSVLARRLIRDRFLVAATGTVLVSSILVLPLALIYEPPWSLDPTVTSAAAVIWLGIGPTALATIIYYALISNAGPTFMSLVNYLSPVVAVSLGVAVLGENPPVWAYFGLVFILSGIALSQWRSAPAPVRRT